MPRTHLSRLIALLLAALVLGSITQAPAEAAKKVKRSVTFSVSASSVLTSAPVTFAGKVSKSPKGSLISIQRRAGSKWVTVRQVRTTNKAGAFRTALAMPGTAGTYYFRALAVKKGKLQGALSRTVGVKALVRVTATLTASATKVPAGSQISVSGTVKPFRPLALVQVQKQTGGVWRNYTSAPLQQDGTFSADVQVGPTTPLRVAVPAVGWYGPAYSPIVTVATTPVIATSSLPTARQFQAYSGKLVTIDGSAGTWLVQGKPDWMVLNPTTGALTGTPTTKQASQVTFAFQNAAGEVSPARTFQIEVQPSTTAPTIDTSALPNAVRTNAYSGTLKASGPGPDRTGAWKANTKLPPGLSLNASTGVVSGTVTNSDALGTWAVSFTYTQANTGLSVDKTVTIAVTEAPAPTITTTSLPGGTVGSAYSVTLAATGPNGTGGTAAATGTWTASPLPAGLSLNANTGVISGTPTTAGSTNVVLTFTHSRTGLTTTRTNALAVKPVVTTSSVAPATVGQAYSVVLEAAGGTGGTWAASPRPAGISINASTGELSGTPTAAGSTNVVVTYKVNNQTSASRTIVLAVKPAVTTTSLPTGTVGSAYSATLTAAGGTGGTWTASPLPNGISLNASTGALTGTPTTAGTTSVELTYTVSGQISAIGTVDLAVRPAVTTTSLPTGTVGSAYSATLTAAGGAGGTWTASPRPAGISINASTGELSGTPTTAGSTEVVVTYTRGGQTSASRTIVLAVKPAVTTASLPTATTGSAYSATLAGAGGTGGTWTASPLPAGIDLDPTTGELSGTPTAAGSTNVQVTYTVNGQTSASATLALAVRPRIVTDALPSGTRTMPYSFTLDGTQSGTWTASPLPDGLSLNPSTGAITGTPTTVGSTTVVIGYTVNGQAAATRTLTLVITEADPPTITTASLAAAIVGDPYAQQVQAQGNPAGTWSTDDPLPDGLSIHAGNGTISGTPTESGSFTVKVRFTQTSTGLSATKTLTLHIDPAPEP